MLGYLLDAFLLGAVLLATDSERKSNSNPRKLYPADPGLIGAFDASGRANVGHALETVVLNELERRGTEVGYVKTSASRAGSRTGSPPAGRRPRGCGASGTASSTGPASG